MSGPRIGAAALVALAIAGIGAAQAQYRSGRPDTLRPAPGVKPSAAAEGEAFRHAYERAGRPRIAVFWNRDLDDRLTTGYDRVLEATQSSSHVATVAASPYGDAAIAGGQASAVTTLRAGERATDARGPRALLAERTDWPVVAGFNTTLQSVGVRLVDRALAMRALAAAADAAERRDVQTVELKALQDKAELMVEVLQTPDAGAPLGVMFRIDVISVTSGEILASIATDGQPEAAAPGRFVAGADGFVREAPREPSAAEIGQVLAQATMAALAGRLPVASP